MYNGICSQNWNAEVDGRCEKKDKYYIECNINTRSELSVPIKYNGECIGVLNEELKTLREINQKIKSRE
jgi:putative methionine-R-sulfoxide reductase with GAF domain